MRRGTSRSRTCQAAAKAGGKHRSAVRAASPTKRESPEGQTATSPVRPRGGREGHPCPNVGGHPPSHARANPPQRARAPSGGSAVPRELRQEAVHVRTRNLPFNQPQKPATSLLQAQRHPPALRQSLQPAAPSPLPQPAGEADPDRHGDERRGQVRTAHAIAAAIPAPNDLSGPILRKNHPSGGAQRQRALTFAHAGFTNAEERGASWSRVPASFGRPRGRHGRQPTGDKDRLDRYGARDGAAVLAGAGRGGFSSRFS